MNYKILKLVAYEGTEIKFHVLRIKNEFDITKYWFSYRKGEE